MKKIFLLMMLVFALFISGCSKQAEISDQYYNGDSTQDDYEGSSSVKGGTSDLFQTVAYENRKIIYIADIDLVSTDPADVYDLVTSKLSEHNAYIENEKIQSSIYEVVIRVKSENLNAFINDLKSEGEVVNYEKTSKDITNDYSTAEARKLALEAEHARILELIEVAENLEDIMTLEDARFEIQTELNSINLRLASYDASVDYSTINLTITKIENLDEILERTERPRIRLEEKTSDEVIVQVTNNSENTALITLYVKHNGETIKEFSQDVNGTGKVEFKVLDLKQNSEYKFEVYAKEDGLRQSYSQVIEVTTEKVFGSKVGTVFKGSIEALGQVLEFLLLAIIAIAPFAVVFLIFFIPLRIYYNAKIKPKQEARRIELEERRKELRRQRLERNKDKQ